MILSRKYYFVLSLLLSQVAYIFSKSEETETSKVEGNIYALCYGIPPYSELMAKGYILLNSKSKRDDLDGVNSRIATLQNQTKTLYEDVEKYLEDQRKDLPHHDVLEKIMKNATQEVLKALEKMENDVEKHENENNNGTSSEESDSDELDLSVGGDGLNRYHKRQIIHTELKPAIFKLQQACRKMTDYIRSNTFQPKDPVY